MLYITVGFQIPRVKILRKQHAIILILSEKNIIRNQKRCESNLKQCIHLTV